MSKLPPIRLQRLYLNANKTGPFIIKAENLPADVAARMTDAELMARRDEERAAIDAEWARIRSMN